jgi:hypothetical protein
MADPASRAGFINPRVQTLAVSGTGRVSAAETINLKQIRPVLIGFSWRRPGTP